MTNVTYIGNATADAELRYTQSGIAVANVNIAVNTRSKRGEDYVDDPPLFVRVNVWKEQAENVSQSVKKGDRLFVQGRQRMTEFTDREGNTRQNLEVTADEIGPTLRWATATPQKAQRNGGGQSRAQGGYASSPQGGGQQAPDPWAGGGNQGGYDDPPF